MDFEMEIIRVDEERRTITFALTPHRRRYEWVERDGQRWLLDKLDNMLFPETVLEQAARQMEGQQVGFQRQRIDSAEAYVESRAPRIRASLTGPVVPAALTDKSEEFLDSLAVDRMEFAVLCLDIVGSTRLSTSMPPDEYTRLISTMLSELSEVVPNFLGHVLKYTGDGLIAYFPAPSFIRMNDLALDCALTMHRLVYAGINPILEEQGYKPVDIRIGIDSGEAAIVVVGSPETKQHKDIIGAIVNLAAKIQSMAAPGRIALGNTVLRNLHVMWREVCEEIKPKRDWPYKDEEGQPYSVYAVIPGARLKSVSGRE